MHKRRVGMERIIIREVCLFTFGAVCGVDKERNGELVVGVID